MVVELTDGWLGGGGCCRRLRRLTVQSHTLTDELADSLDFSCRPSDRILRPARRDIFLNHPEIVQRQRLVAFQIRHLHCVGVFMSNALAF